MELQRVLDWIVNREWVAVLSVVVSGLTFVATSLDGVEVESWSALAPIVAGALMRSQVTSNATVAKNEKELRDELARAKTRDDAIAQIDGLAQG